VTWLVDAADLDRFVDDVTARLAAGAPLAIAQNKELLTEGGNCTIAEALLNEARTQAVNFGTADAHEALAAFNAKREPEFTGEWLVK
jgi:enoyl-CoA hydratase/carnithine racemase